LAEALGVRAELVRQSKTGKPERPQKPPTRLFRPPYHPKSKKKDKDKIFSYSGIYSEVPIEDIQNDTAAQALLRTIPHAKEIDLRAHKNRHDDRIVFAQKP